MTRVKQSVVFLDSAGIDDAREAARAGYIDGITTNPVLMRRHAADPLEQLRELLAAFPDGPVFYQPRTAIEAEAEAEAHRALALSPDRVVIKIPAREQLLRLAAKLTKGGAVTALTAVFTPGQAVLAAAAGCRWVIPYVDRAERDPAGGHDIIRRIAAPLERGGSDVRILAASIKSVGQALAALEAGAHAVSAPLEIVQGLAFHPMTERAITDFEAAYRARNELEGAVP